ncbi:hypothetical protein CVT26_003514 [Gymnopilus dilepis]|uniref:Uncharacterized protein n=1 Tax=Gymnopilus dilepis TaxID=231916 RepID=A0A409W334_9AGAR|nr:hypothetical protein CVT26_003514 [Gymnopilus dilepis]
MGTHEVELPDTRIAQKLSLTKLDPPSVQESLPPHTYLPELSESVINMINIIKYLLKELITSLASWGPQLFSPHPKWALKRNPGPGAKKPYAISPSPAEG